MTSTNAHCTGAISVWMEFYYIPLVHNERLFMAELMHTSHLGVFELTRLLGITPNMDRIFILLKGKCPRL